MVKCVVAVLLMVVHSGCVKSAVAPTAMRRWVVSGQSNAVSVGPHLQRLHPNTALSGRGAQTIDYWDDGRDGWQALAPLLEPPTDVFVWWQGESDALAQTPDYEMRLKTLLRRVRTAARNERLFVVIVRITDLPPTVAARGEGPSWEAIRRSQAEVVAADGHAVLVSSDGLGGGSADIPAEHLGTMASRIVATIPDSLLTRLVSKGVLTNARKARIVAGTAPA